MDIRLSSHADCTISDDMYTRASGLTIATRQYEKSRAEKA
jgi:hypothetical protein